MQPEKNKWLVLREPLQPPAIYSRLEELNAVARSTECLRHFVLSIEFWISPGGKLRHWMKLNVCLAAFLLIPAVLSMPIVSLVLHEVDEWLSMLLSIVWKLIVLGVLVVVVGVIRHRQKRFPSSSGSPNTRHRKRRTPRSGGIAL